MHKIWHPSKSVILTKNIGEGTNIHAPVWLGKDVMIGKNVKIQSFAFVPEGVSIGDNVFIGPGVIFTNDKYPPSGEWVKTIVEEGVSIGANSTILPGIVIGRGSRIGAGSVVTKDVPHWETWYGNPAKKQEINGKNIHNNRFRIYIPKACRSNKGDRGRNSGSNKRECKDNVEKTNSENAVQLHNSNNP